MASRWPSSPTARARRCRPTPRSCRTYRRCSGNRSPVRANRDMSEGLVIEREQRVAIVRMHRPQRRNAMSLAYMRELTHTAETLRDDGEIDVVLLTGGPRWFSAGADLKDEERWSIGSKPLDEQREIGQTGYRMARAWEELPQITIAAIEGYALGGGLALALACDWRVLAEDAFVGVPEIGLGIPLTWGTLPRLIALACPARAKR